MLNAAPRYLLSIAIALTFLLSGTVWADSLTLVTNPASQGANDSLNWSQQGGDGTVLAAGFSGNTALGSAVTVGLAGANSVISVVCAATPCSWTGTGFIAGHSLLWTSDAANGGNGPVTLTFAKPVAGVGAAIQANMPGAFTAKIEVFNGATSLGSFTVSSSSGAATYIGVEDQTGANITSAVFSLTACATSCTDFALDTVALNTVTQAAITSPANGSTLSGSSVTFNWTAGTGAVSYQLWVGSTAGAHDVAVAITSGLSATVSNLPTNGSTLFVRLYSYNGSTWSFSSYSYTAATITQAAITSPVNGSTLSGSTVTFNWTAGTGAVSYQLWVGSTAGAHDIAVAITSGLSATVSHLPTNGSTLYVRLYSYNGSTWTSSSYTYTAATIVQAAITSPANGSTLSGSSVTFNWTAGTGAVSYQLWVGSTAGAHDVAVAITSGLSATVSNLPTNGSTLFVRLYSYNGSSWSFSSYTYTAATITQAAITSPVNGSTLSGSTVTFNWTAGTGVVSYQLWVGNTPGAHDIAVAIASGLSATVANLPTDGRTLYVRLYSYNGSTWSYSSYTYTAF